MAEVLFEISLDTPWEQVNELLHKYHSFHDGEIISCNIDCVQNKITMNIEVEYDWDNHLYGSFLLEFIDFQYCQFYYDNINDIGGSFDVQGLRVSVGMNSMTVNLEPQLYGPISHFYCKKIICRMLASCKTENYEMISAKSKDDKKEE